MATLPSHIRTQIAPDAGTGVFASDDIPPGVEILCIDRPLVSVLDSARLKDTCSECNLWLPENGHDRGPQSTRLKTCQGCKITRYCCKVGRFLLYHMPLKQWSMTTPSIINSKPSCMSNTLSFVSPALYVQRLSAHLEFGQIFYQA